MTDQTMFDLAPHTIFITLAGSHAHGTARQGSDVDLRGVCIAPLEVRLSYRGDFEQYEGELPASLRAAIEPRLASHPTAGHARHVGVESVVFDVAKLVRLCADANPNALEIVFADERDWMLSTPTWQELQRARDRFLSRKVRDTYLGYALAQLKRIRTHRAWLLSPPARKPERGDFGLPDAATLNQDDRNRIEQAIAEKLRSWGIDELEMPRSTRVALSDRLRRFWGEALSASEESLDDDLHRAAARSLGLSRGLVEALEAEKKYRAATKQWESYQTWKHDRNPARAELEARFGYDTKHAMHLVRLMRTGLELLETGTLNVRRADAVELKAIRDGALSYDHLLADADAMRARMAEAAERSPLPAEVDHAEIERLLVGLIRRTVA